MTIHPQDRPASRPSRRWRCGRVSALPLAALCAALASMHLGLDVRAEEAPPSDSAPARPRVPKVSADGPPMRIAGKILRSSRGKKGPVRLLVERKDGEPVTVLVGPEDVCDRLGLSLRADEQVVVEGSMLKSERPILIASTFVVDGKTIRVRDAQGEILDPAREATSTGGSAATGPAVTGSKPPEPPPKP